LGNNHGRLYIFTFSCGLGKKRILRHSKKKEKISMLEEILITGGVCFSMVLIGLSLGFLLIKVQGE